MIYNAHIMTWKGLSAGASHYWGVISVPYTVKYKGCVGTDIAYPDVKLQGEYFSREDVMYQIRRWWKLNAKPGDSLVEGHSCTLDPRHILFGPREFKTKGNALWRQAEAIDYWENDPAKMQKLCKQWDKLVEKFYPGLYHNTYWGDDDEQSGKPPKTKKRKKQAA
jgi:hypothetical protein